MFLRVTRFLLFASVLLLSVSGGLYGNPDHAKVQSTLSRVAYFEFAFVLVALFGMAAWLYFVARDKIQDGQVIVCITCDSISIPMTLVLQNIDIRP